MQTVNFFFFKQKTAYEIVSGDWSSDVCSSDLVKQVLRTEAYQIIKSGSTGAIGRRLTARDLLLGAQIAICAVLVTSSIVAVHGLVRSLHSSFGFEPRNAMLVDTDLNMAGYKTDR